MSADLVDELDRKIIAMLGRDGRISNRQVAAELGVTEGTIRSRIKRLQGEGLIQFTAVTSFRMAGSPSLVMFGIHADPSRVPALAEELSRLPQIGGVVVLLGRFSLMATGLFRSVEEVNQLVSSQIRVLAGVRGVEISYSIQTYKYDFKVARITRKATAADGDEV